MGVGGNCLLLMAITRLSSEIVTKKDNIYPKEHLHSLSFAKVKALHYETHYIYEFVVFVLLNL